MEKFYCEECGDEMDEDCDLCDDCAAENEECYNEEYEGDDP